MYTIIRYNQRTTWSYVSRLSIFRENMRRGYFIERNDFPKGKR